ncbi:hypothetical protein MNBD_GAMMA18-2320 [hydrothermal vent metagenome]|uniref:Uncharacterized protein n=1 Tax=hydrothermal vent metagenome TaxID=652676 RepID=A0A3B1ABW7_9ZZZZ
MIKRGEIGIDHGCYMQELFSGSDKMKYVFCKLKLAPIRYRNTALVFRQKKEPGKNPAQLCSSYFFSS